MGYFNEANDFTLFLIDNYKAAVCRRGGIENSYDINLNQGLEGIDIYNHTMSYAEAFKKLFPGEYKKEVDAFMGQFFFSVTTSCGEVVYTNNAALKDAAGIYLLEVNSGIQKNKSYEKLAKLAINWEM